MSHPCLRPHCLRPVPASLLQLLSCHPCHRRSREMHRDSLPLFCGTFTLPNSFLFLSCPTGTCYCDQWNNNYNKGCHVKATMRAKSLQLCPTLCNPMDCSLSGCSLYGILQARILEWAATPSSGDLPDPGIETASLMSPALAGGFFTTSATWEAESHLRYFIPLLVS